MPRGERRRQPARMVPATGPGPAGSEAWRRQIYLLAIAFGAPVLVLVWGLQIRHPAPDPFVVYGHPALLVMCLWATVWLCRGGSLHLAERVVFVCNVAAVLAQSFMAVLTSAQPVLDTASPAYWMLVAVSILGFLMFGRRGAIRLTAGLYLLGIGLPWAALTWRGVTVERPAELLRVQLTCGAILALLCALAWYRERFEHERSERLLQERLANADPLTGLPNRRALYPAIEALLAEVRGGTPGSLLLIDIDHFKRINDTYGHNVGDQTLQAVASLLSGALRTHDQVGRWGGEEFLVVLPGADGPAALEVGRRLNETVARQVHGSAGQITVSIGLTRCTPEDSLQSGVARADEALYRAKALGRNRVEADLVQALGMGPGAAAGEGSSSATGSQDAAPSADEPVVTLSAG
ncbi:GGDEF domain-containing protein [Deinococcus navajonensis]|uniref:GGDEF domain-containing protein n=1 Tax=Deinococcus navajonensis TaxID=309884 RepID=A0ABV8XSU4_9DEIO